MILLLLAQAQATYTGNAACAPCHPAIYQSYQRTAMAQSSGPVDTVPAGAFRHPASGNQYRVASRGTASGRTFSHFIGSGAAGRSYMHTVDGFLFQAPITWYTQLARWDMSPGYELDRAPLWNRPLTPSCLFCHASQPRPIYATENRYADPPFLQNGVGCERCHGPGSQHVAGQAKMVNPAKLEPARRDSVCAQCHLSGEARVEKLGQPLAAFRPGDLLSTYANYFVLPGGRDAGVKATGYVERFAESRCKQASGDKLWCASCHDPHSVPAPAQRVAYFRQKCLACHTEPHPSQTAAAFLRGSGPDCIACHMPRERAVDGGHGVLTDHGIPRKPRPTPPASGAWKLETFLGAGEPRETGLAYAEIGLRTGNRHQQDEAIRLLSPVPPDAAVAVRLGDLLQRQGQLARAEQLYRAAIRQPPAPIAALVNLGIIVGSRGEHEEAIRLWRSALQQNPGQREASVNLARLLRAIGRPQEAALVEQAARRFDER